MPTRRQFLTGLGATGFALVVGRRAVTLTRLGQASPDAAVSGQVTSTGGSPLGNARVTLFTPDITYFREVRTDGAGQYALTSVPPGTYRLGAYSLSRDYQEVSISVVEPGASHDFSLAPDTHPGAWTVIGNTDPEVFGGTNSGSIMSNGRIFYCHDTKDPVVFDPVTRIK